MIHLLRVGTHRHIMPNARRFERNPLTGGVTVWFPDGVVGDYLPSEVEVVDIRRGGAQ